MTLAARAGHLGCFCPEDGAPDAGPLRPADTLSLALGFGAAVTAQAAALGILPIAGAALAPTPALGAVPAAALLLGALLATFPAALLLDAFGRRAGFALGASIGAAGGLILAWALLHASFVLLVLGAFWLGTAGGFATFYRHAAAADGASRRRIAWVLGAGALAGIVSPPALAVAEALSAPHTFVGVALVAAAAQVAALLLALRVPDAESRLVPPIAAAAVPRQALAPTLAAAAAWAGMALSMAAVPAAMHGCGAAAEGIRSAVAWHVVAMYAPALATGLLLRHVDDAVLAGAGLALVALGLLPLALGAGAAWLGLGMLPAGAGWSIATAAATRWLHRAARPGRFMLAAHDAALIFAALAGALAAGPLLG